MAAARDPGARHNCWAYRIAQDYRSSDDGEPGGTAGRPILAAIEGEALEAVCVLVTRWGHDSRDTLKAMHRAAKPSFHAS